MLSSADICFGPVRNVSLSAEPHPGTDEFRPKLADLVYIARDRGRYSQKVLKKYTFGYNPAKVNLHWRGSCAAGGMPGRW
jgi:hypothetical protein